MNKNSLTHACGSFPTILALVVACFVLLFRRALGHGIRYGEARNPGPEMLQVALCNPTALTNKADAFRTLQHSHNCQIIAAAETSATTPAQTMIQRQMRQLGYHSAFTTAAPSLRARADHQISLRGKASGCACFSRAPIRFPRCQQLIHPGMDLRLLHIIIDEWKLQIVIIYGLAQSNAGAQDFNNDLLALAARRVQQINLPAIIMGDFNADASQLAATSALARNGFLHLQQLYSHLYGQSMPPTCKDATNPDTAFLSPELLPRLQAIRALQEPLFDAHKVVLFSLQAQIGNLTKQVWPRPKAFTDLGLRPQTYITFPLQLPWRLGGYVWSKLWMWHCARLPRAPISHGDYLVLFGGGANPPGPSRFL